jgi:hypothetical protein
VEKKPDMVEFPSMEYICAGDTEENERNFKCEIYDRVLDILKLSVKGGNSKSLMSLESNVDGKEAEPKEADVVAKECEQMESVLDSFYRGLVSEKMEDGTSVVLAMFDYDVISKLVQRHDDSNPGAIFEINDNSIYPIHDENIRSTLKWAIVDEIIFNNTIELTPIHPTIFEVFIKHDNLWNIEDVYHAYIDFPFLVYNLEETSTKEVDSTEEEIPEHSVEQDNVENAENAEDNIPKFRTVKVSPPEDEEGSMLRSESMFVADSFDTTAFSVSELDNYGKEDEYDNRYCFTQKPLPNKEESAANKRYAMFRWKTRYILDEETHAESNPDGEIEDKLAEEKLEVPTIYFKMHQDNEHIVVWGVKHNNQFIAL